jgi:ATP-dependent DNA ligase
MASEAKRLRTAAFVEPMERLPVTKIPEGPQWTYEIKLDVYRMPAVKSKGRVTLYSRRKNDFTKRFAYVAAALQDIPDETVIDGELVALDDDGKPNFNLLQDFRSRWSVLSTMSRCCAVTCAL